MKNQKLKSLIPVLLCLVGGSLIGIGVTILNPGRIPLRGFLAGTLLGSICIAVLFLSWKWSGGKRLLAICLGIAFLLRLIRLQFCLTLPVVYLVFCQVLF